MKRLCLYTLLIIMTLLPTLSACDGLEISRNGDLDGMWHLIEVDSLNLGTSPKIIDYTYERIYWSVQDDLLSVEDKHKRYMPCLLRFNHENKTLIVKDPYINHNRLMADEKIEDVSYLRPFGINKLEDKFDVVTLNRKKMILENENLKLVFKRY